MSHVIFSSILELSFTKKVYVFCKMKIVTSHLGRERGSKPLSPNDTLGWGLK